NWTTSAAASFATLRAKSPNRCVLSGGMERGFRPLAVSTNDRSPKPIVTSTEGSCGAGAVGGATAGAGAGVPLRPRDEDVVDDGLELVILEVRLTEEVPRPVLEQQVAD